MENNKRARKEEKTLKRKTMDDNHECKPTVEFKPPPPITNWLFSFGEKKKPIVPAEKSDHEKEIEDLFAQFANAVAYDKADREREMTDLFAQCENAMACDQASTDSASASAASKVEVESKDSVPPGKELTQEDLCGQGNHDLYIDEEIGEICRYCPYVHLEIKYILPPFAPNPYGKKRRRRY